VAVKRAEVEVDHHRKATVTHARC